MIEPSQNKSGHAEASIARDTTDSEVIFQVKLTEPLFPERGRELSNLLTNEHFFHQVK